MEKLIIGRKTTIGYVDLGFSCKMLFMLGMLYTFIQYLSPSLNKSQSSRANKSQIFLLSFGRS